jgi:hypothetical protein
VALLCLRTLKCIAAQRVCLEPVLNPRWLAILAVEVGYVDWHIDRFFLSQVLAAHDHLLARVFES